MKTIINMFKLFKSKPQRNCLCCRSLCNAGGFNYDLCAECYEIQVSQQLKSENWSNRLKY